MAPTSLLALVAALTAPVAPRPVTDSLPVVPCDALAASVTTAGRAGDLAATLAIHGGVVRWDVADAPVRVWLQRRPVDASSFAHDDSEWRSALVAAVAAWSTSAATPRLTVVRDSAVADVRVQWTPALAASDYGDPAAGGRALDATTMSFTAGRTLLVPDTTGRAVVARILLASSSPDGIPYTPRDVHAVAQHELGHALGLAHHRSPQSVMSPTVAVEHVGDDDRAVLRALYALPVGTACRATH